eukprot:RCo038312
MASPVVVLDCGTGFTKMGFAGNREPAFVVPSVYGDSASSSTGASASRRGLEDLDFLIGYEALERCQNYQPHYPIKRGVVENWDQMERIWQQCFYKYLRCEPEDHYVLLTESSLNSPENREYTAEVMFETFGVRGLYIASSAVLALAASWTSKKSKEKELAGTMTGIVVDSGDGSTSIIPVAEGYVVSSCIRHIPLAGRDITHYIQQMLRDREEPVPPEDLQQAAQKIKETHCYVCQDIAKEFQLYDADMKNNVTIHSGKSQKTQQKWSISVAYEKFLGPELFFSPEIFSSEFTTPLPQLVDACIQQCPIDCRRGLYRNIVLSGGSTMFRNFEKRLQRDVKRLIDARLEESWRLTANRNQPKADMEVNVIAPPVQRYAVWFGGSWLGDTQEFFSLAKTKAQYDEWGPSICRHNAGFEAPGAFATP